MDSSTYGVPSNSPNGYRTEVDYATQISYSGIYVHAAPWSVGSQGYSNVSHGCLNVSTSNAQWFYDNTKRGDIVEIVNTVGSILPGDRRPRRLEHPVGAVEGRQRQHLTADEMVGGDRSGMRHRDDRVLRFVYTWVGDAG